jgi:hypothetical protein
MTRHLRENHVRKQKRLLNLVKLVIFSEVTSFLAPFSPNAYAMDARWGKKHLFNSTLQLFSGIYGFK